MPVLLANRYGIAPPQRKFAAQCFGRRIPHDDRTDPFTVPRPDRPRLRVPGDALLPLDLVKLLGCDVATARQLWTVVLLAYCFAASVLPVWLLLQPRDYLNSYLLYAMMALGFIGIFVARPALNLDAFAGWHTVSPLSGRSDPTRMSRSIRSSALESALGR